MADSFHVSLVGWQGSPVPWTVIVSNADLTPKDVSGWVVMFTVKRYYTDSDEQAIYLHDFTMPPLSIDGTIGDELPDTKTQSLLPADYPFDVRVIMLPGNEPQMLLAGKITINNTVGTRLLPQL